MARLRFLISGGTVAAITAALAFPTPAVADVSLPKPRGAVASKTVKKGQKQVLSYWTRKRMRRATPLTAEPPSLSSSTAGAPAAEDADPILIEGDTPPGWEADSGPDGERLPRGLATPPSGPPPGESGPIPFTSVELDDTTSYPARTHGNVFFRLGRANYSCSATVVNSQSQSVVLTAGHCVHYGGKHRPWATNWVFAPGYKDTASPFGIWVARDLFTSKGWRKRARFAFDIGAAAIHPNSAGQTVESVVGSRGVAFNQPREQLYRSYGYPVTPAPKFDGESLWTCESEYAYNDPFPEPRGPAQSAIGCDMGAGSSGGAWVVNEQYVNSVNSFGYSFLPSVLFGTYFGDTAAQVYSAAVNG